VAYISPDALVETCKKAQDLVLPEGPDTIRWQRPYVRYTKINEAARER
jgi:hypothetical protein